MICEEKIVLESRFKTWNVRLLSANPYHRRCMRAFIANNSYTPIVLLSDHELMTSFAPKNVNEDAMIADLEYFAKQLELKLELV